MLNQIGRLDRTGLGGLDGKARGRGRKRRVVAAGERNGKRLAQTRHDGHINSSAAQHIALEYAQNVTHCPSDPSHRSLENNPNNDTSSVDTPSAPIDDPTPSVNRTPRIAQQVACR